MKHCMMRDEKITDGRNLKDAHADAYEKTTKALIEIWGPHAEIYSFTSTGHKVSKGYTGPFVSFRHLVRKVGKFKCGADIKRLGKVPEMFDQRKANANCYGYGVEAKREKIAPCSICIEMVVRSWAK